MRSRAKKNERRCRRAARRTARWPDHWIHGPALLRALLELGPRDDRQLIRRARILTQGRQLLQGARQARAVRPKWWLSDERIHAAGLPASRLAGLPRNNLLGYTQLPPRLTRTVLAATPAWPDVLHGRPCRILPRSALSRAPVPDPLLSFLAEFRSEP